MKKLLLLLLLVSCSTPHQVQTIYNYKDSTVVNYKDSTVLIPVETIINVTPEQRSDLETTVAMSTAYTDSLGLLHHTLQNKQDVIYKYIYRDKERIVRDTVITQVPVEVRVPEKYVPRIYSFTFWFVVVVLAGLVVFYLIKKKIL